MAHTKRSKVLLYTTTVTAEKSIRQICQVLSGLGETQVMQQYDAEGRVTGLAFLLLLPDGRQAPVTIPCRIDGVVTALKAGMTAQGLRTQAGKGFPGLADKAYRIAWRQALLWTKAQFALIDLGMMEPAEVFLSHLSLGGPGSPTFYETIVANKFKALPAPQGA